MEYQSVLLLINDHDAAALPSGTGFLGSWTLPGFCHRRPRLAHHRFFCFVSFFLCRASIIPICIPIYSSFSIILARRAPLSVSLCLSATVYYCTLLLLLTSFQSSPPPRPAARG
jgi:hypothetical protein